MSKKTIISRQPYFPSEGVARKVMEIKWGVKKPNCIRINRKPVRVRWLGEIGVRLTRVAECKGPTVVRQVDFVEEGRENLREAIRNFSTNAK